MDLEMALICLCYNDKKKEELLMKILLGTYTRNSSEGIYEINLNTETNKLEDLKLVAKTSNPTYLDFDKDTKTVYSVYQDGDDAGIATWKQTKGEKLEKTSTITQEETPPCYVKYKKNENLVYTANYHLGKMTIYNEDSIEKEVQYEDGAHAHYTDFDPKTGLLYVCDLGNDKVYKYDGDKEIAHIRLEEGSGPRHIAFHPSLDRMYVFGELNNTVTVLDSDFNIYQIISTLEDEDEESSGAAIRITNDGSFLYASNRGEDSIITYAIKTSGELEVLETVSSEGEHPRDFSLSPDETYLVVANRDTNNLTLFKRDTETGKLELLEKDVHAPEAVCVLFLEK